jgi:hypothetical protein
MNERQIQAELDRMDGGLFLDKEADEYGRIFYSVKHHLQGSVSPYTALKWTYPDGNPKPLSEDLLVALRAQEGSIQEALTQAMVNNAALRELQRQQADKEAMEIAEEWDKTKRSKKSVSIGPGSIDHKTSLNKRDL